MHSALPARAPVNAFGLRVPYRLRGAGSLVRPVQQCFCLTGACGFGCSLLGPISASHRPTGVDEMLVLQSPVPDQAVRHLAVPAVVADRDIRQRTHARRDTVARRHCGLDMSDSATPLSPAGPDMIEQRADAPTRARPGLSRTQPTNACCRQGSANRRGRGPSDTASHGPR